MRQCNEKDCEYCAEVEMEEDGVAALCLAPDSSWILVIWYLHGRDYRCPMEPDGLYYNEKDFTWIEEEGFGDL